MEFLTKYETSTIQFEGQIKMEIELIQNFLWIVYLVEEISNWFDFDPTVHEFMKIPWTQLDRGILNQNVSFLKYTCIYSSSNHDPVENPNSGESPHLNVLYKTLRMWTLSMCVKK